MEDQFGIHIPARFWKSHLLVTKRLTEPGVFCVDPGEAAMMNHGDFSIVGFNEDAIKQSVPDVSVIDERVAQGIESNSKSSIITEAVLLLVTITVMYFIMAFDWVKFLEKRKQKKM